MNRYRLSKNARADLEEIWESLAEEGSEAMANRILEELGGRFSLIGKLPASGRPRPEFGSDIRSFPSGNYIIYYHWNARGQRVLISRVVHGMRDQKKALRSRPS